MEPVDIMKKEKHLLECLQELRDKIFSPVQELDVVYAPTKEPVPWEERNQLTYEKLPKNKRWADVFGCAWFRVSGQVPENVKGKHVIAHIDIGGEGLVYETGTEKKVVGAVTLDTSFIDRLQAVVAKSVVEIGNPVQGGEQIAFEIDAGFNGYYNHPVGRAYFKCATLLTVEDELLDYYYDFLTVATICASEENAEKKAKLYEVLDHSMSLLDTSLVTAKEELQAILQEGEESAFEFTAIGHSHLDLAWLWPMRETKRKACRTFTHQIRNMERYPDYIYGASQPQQFEFVRETHPEIYDRMKQFAKSGQLECQGAMWVEADMNVPSGESLIRQILYGTKYFKEEFGQTVNICWLPDVFGYNGNLPQILKKSGIPYFLTIKLSWNEHNKFPNRSFVWRGIDGSEILTHMPPAETYNAAASPACAAFGYKNYPEKDVSNHAILLYGIGDGGGGPSEAHIEMGRRQKALKGRPQVSFGTSREFFAKLEQEKAGLPCYEGELYLEKHQGTYTTQAFNKYCNRKIEFALQTIEALYTMVKKDGVTYPKEKLDELWKRVLLLQFHDILPGSSIQRVYTESRAEYLELFDEIKTLSERFCAKQTENAGEECVAFNPTSYERKVWMKKEDAWFYGVLPSYGINRLKLYEESPVFDYSENHMENEFVKVVFAEDGMIQSLVDKKTGFDYAGEYLNRLTIYEDEFLEYNAWDIEWEYYNKPYTVLKSSHTRTYQDGPYLIRESVYTHDKSVITQKVRLEADSDVVYFDTHCDWDEKLKMLRADFVPSVYSDTVKCDIQMGIIERSTREDTPVEKAQFEICAHKFVDVSNGERGLSLLNDCKYGHRVKNGQISLNLLRSTILPDPQADIGSHTFSYALCMHEGECAEKTVKESYFLNQQPLLLNGNYAPFSMAAVSNENIVIETIKEACDGDGIVIRLYEALGKETETTLTVHLPYEKAYSCSLLEEKEGMTDLSHLTFGPFEIKTIRLCQ